MDERHPLPFSGVRGPLPTSDLSDLLLSPPGPVHGSHCRYSVTVQAASRLGRVASEPRRIRTQRRIVANRLVSPLSALLNASVTFTCRLNFGTNVAFLWDFGDGTVGPGGSSAHHTYQR